MAAKLPKRVVGPKLVGWLLTHNAAPVNGTFSTADAAKAHAADDCSHPLAWIVKATDPEGNCHLRGGHPLAIECDQAVSFDTVASVQRSQEASDRLRDAIGHKAAQDRWSIAPEYRAVSRPVREAIRAWPGSAFFAAPGMIKPYWAIWQEGRSQPVEDHHTRVAAIDGARRMAMGLRSARVRRNARRSIVGLAFVVIVQAAVVFLVAG